MAGRIAAPLDLTTEQREELTALSRAHSTPRKLTVRRCGGKSMKAISVEKGNAA